MASSQASIVAWMAKLAWRNVLRNWRHGLATLLAIATGFMAISVFDGFIRELEETTNDGYTSKAMLGHIVIQHAGASKHLQEDPWRYALSVPEQQFVDAFLESDPDFSRRVRFLHAYGMINAGSNSSIFMGYGYDLKEGAAVRGERWAWDTVAGEPLYQSPEHSVILGTKLGELMGCTTSFSGNYRLPEGNFVPENRPFQCTASEILLSATTEAAQINAVSLEVAGLFDAGFREANTRALYLSLADAQRLLDTDKITMVGVLLTEAAAADDFIKRFEAAAAAKQLTFDIVPWQQHPLASYAQGGMELLRVFRNLFMVIVVLISVMAVASTMMKAVNERIREIGTMRSFGFLRHDIAIMFAWEGFFISMLACGVGLLLTLSLSKLIGALGISYKAGVLSMPLILQVAYAPTAWLWSASLLSSLATLTAWLCARRASRMVVADALQHV